ncbi:uncharacterized protein LOC111054991 [Nilaparvata lugens]|uniref:uncharacterized protein LOC111054991 n=1 Tax=Nilaparvata lugens TaxID=108931 RepID=UPI000B983656|nr:uncharacterized protein LOC111054991 [Nilaparvata lugens]XP_039293682.1 uncharacterized protein LOC111054991 [Nilaparvata lugens]XP_039293683.1 uncharacterized protein LOC111054991 [Nilaparvata lugens]XP_039293684.1 uncharacterized protein LOC111054991 [Nilaparvata lugens]
MSLPELEETVCGCSVRTGSKIIGWMSLVIGVIELVGIISVLIFLSPETLEDIKNYDVPEDNIAYTDVGAAILAIAAFIVLISLFCTVLLLIGIIKDRHTFIYPWILLHIIMTIGSYLAGISSLLTHGPNREGAKEIVVALISTYFVLVVNSHYMSVKKSTQKAVLVNC